MNTNYIIETFRNFILDNEDLLLTGIIHQDQQRKIMQVADSRLDPPVAYYYVLVAVSQGRSFSKMGPTNRQLPTRAARYNVEIEISDEALIQLSEPRPYTTMAGDFRLWTDRLVSLIEDTKSFGVDPRLELARSDGESDRLVEKIDLSGIFQDTETTGTASLFCQILFTIYEGCVDSSRLYN